jgi:cellulose synthase/poly-beta-1,6-N-acetylglucosamine synthase-like glycosyltransferase
MKTVKIDVTSKDRASRLELFIRILWLIVGGIILWLYSIIAAICIIVQWFFILIMGRRNKSLNNVIKVYLYYRTKFEAYLMMLTDERSPLLPED